MNSHLKQPSSFPLLFFSIQMLPCENEIIEYPSLNMLQEAYFNGWSRDFKLLHNLNQQIKRESNAMIKSQKIVEKKA